MPRSTAVARLAAALVLLTPSAGFAQGRLTMTLSVDATDAPRKMLHTKERIPVRPGALTLLYPKWIPGEHGPTGPLTDVAGLKISAKGTPIAWRRDLEEMYAIHLDVPAGTDTIDVQLDYLVPPLAQGFTSGASATAELLVLSWNQVVLYPSTPKPDSLTVIPALTLPDGWKFATALSAQGQPTGTVRFAPVSLTTLVDSPVLAAVHLKRIEITPPGGVPHFLDIASDNDAALEVTPEELAGFKALAVEANALFGAHHFDHYDFLFTLSDQVAHFGLEHHQSSDDRVAERTLLDNNLWRASADLLPHEFTHSWNGKHRRPLGLATNDFSTPMKGDLLWVYEGLTQYIGKMLSGRSGLRSADEFREDQASLAARLDNRPGRTWRPLQDVNDEAQLLYYTRADYDSWRRSVDYYDEGDLIWLEADVTIRKLTNGQQSLDDFVRRFHGGTSSGPSLKPYTFDDLVAGLNAVAANDWRGFLTTRLTSLSARAPLGGIEGAGWRLVYTDRPNAIDASGEVNNGFVDQRYSMGFAVLNDGTVVDVIPGTPAAQGGLAPGFKLLSVSGKSFSPGALHDAVRGAKGSTAAIQFVAANGVVVKTYAVDYHGGERYPHLERDVAKPDVLTTIITPIGKK